MKVRQLGDPLAAANARMRVPVFLPSLDEEVRVISSGNIGFEMPAEDIRLGSDVGFEMPAEDIRAWEVTSEKEETL